MHHSKSFKCTECGQIIRFQEHKPKCSLHPSKWSNVYSKKAEPSIPISKIEEWIKENKRINTPKSYTNVIVKSNVLEKLQAFIDEAKQ